jgi:glycosyltransferase involved in cell wall biosynthesis
LKILHVTPFYEPAWAYGGMARASSALARALARRGHAVTVVTAQHDAAHARDEILGGVRVHRFSGPRFLRERLVPWGHGLAGFLRRQPGPVDVAHFHGHRSGIALVAASALGRSRTPWVLSPAGTYPHHHQWTLLKWLYDRAAGQSIVTRASAILAVSQAEARDLPRPAQVIPNGVDAPGVPAPAVRAAANALLFVGSDRPQKRGLILPAVLEALPAATLTLVGRFGTAFLRTFERFGPRVRAHGVLEGDALASAYASANLLLHPAVGESFGLVPFEAALCGTEAVVAGGHGCGEWFAAAGGCVVPPDDREALLRAVAERLGDAARCGTEASAVAAFARRALTWDAAAAETEKVYEAVIGSPPRPRP